VLAGFAGLKLTLSSALLPVVKVTEVGLKVTSVTCVPVGSVVTVTVQDFDTLPTVAVIKTVVGKVALEVRGAIILPSLTVTIA